MFASHGDEASTNRKESHSSNPCRSKVYIESNFSQREICKQWLMQYSAVHCFRLARACQQLWNSTGLSQRNVPKETVAQFKTTLRNMLLLWFAIVHFWQRKIAPNIRAERFETTLNISCQLWKIVADSATTWSTLTFWRRLTWNKMHRPPS